MLQRYTFYLIPNKNTSFNLQFSIFNSQFSIFNSQFSIPQRLVLAVAHAGEVADEAAILIGDADPDGGNPAVVDDADGLSPQAVALHSTRKEHHIAADAESEVTLMIHQRRHSQVGQREEGATLAHAPGVQVFLRHRHLRHGMHGVHLRNPTAGISCKPVGSVQYFLYVCHNDKRV